MFDSILETLRRLLWSPNIKVDKGPAGLGIAVLRYAFALIRDLASGQLTMRAMSLVYTTLLSVVPLTAFSFSVLKAFGVHRELEPRLYDFMLPLGEKGEQITKRLLDLVDNVEGGVLGGVSLAFFIYTSVSMVQKIEESVNYVWHVGSPRSLARRFTEYFSVLLMGPVVMVVAIGMIASIRNNSLVQRLSETEPFGTTLVLGGKLMPYVLAVLALTFLYKFIPNTRVRIRSAFIGGLTAGVFWATTSAVFASIVVSATRIQVIYSGFAIAILALMWVYLNWLILLLGAQIAFYSQHPAFLRLGRREADLSNSLRERLALNIMYLVGSAFRDSARGESVRGIARRLAVPGIVVSQVVENLEQQGLIATTENEGLVPGKETSRIRLTEIIDAVRQKGDTGSWRPPEWSPGVRELGDRIDGAVAAVVEESTLSELLDEIESRRPAAD